VAGHGTVVTGSVSSGTARVGDELVIEPGSMKVRLRGLQNHDQQVAAVHRGQRAAMNLAGVHHDQLGRGQEVCAAGHLVPSRLLTVDLALLESAPRPLKHRRRLRVHVGTAELLAQVSLLEGEQIAPGERGAAQLFLRDPAVTVWSQPLVIRSESPVMTIGGGRVLDPNAERIRRADAEQLEMIQRLRSGDPVARSSAALYFNGWRPWQPGDLPRTAGVGAYQDTYQALVDRGDVRPITLSPSRTLIVHQRIFQRLTQRMLQVLDKLHDAHPLRTVLDRAWLAQRFEYLPDPALLAEGLRQLQAEGKATVTPKGIALVGRGPKLSQNEQKLLNRLVDDFRQAGFEAPSVKQYQQAVSKNQDSVPQLLALAAANGDLVEISSEFYLHSEIEHASRRRLAERMTASDGLTMSEIREILNTTRKYAVPFCEYLDRIGFTERRGDLRVLAMPAGPSPANETSV
jgi:selenocysteine-specific elongation factor